MSSLIPQGEDAQLAQQQRLESLRARQASKAAHASALAREAPSSLQLRPYQLEAVEAATMPNAGVWRRLVVMATGGGKTLVVAEIIKRMLAPGQSALVIAHRDELLSQVIAELKGHIPDAIIEREQAENRASRAGSLPGGSRRVVVASVQSMQRKRLESFAPDAFSFVVCDEVHHAIAPSYRRIFEYLGCLDDERRVPLIGVTATPQRSDSIGLDNLFQELSTSHGIRDLIEQGHLCNIRALSVKTETDLAGIRITAGDYNAKQLEDATDTAERNARIVAAHRKYATDRPTLCFATGVDHAKHLAELFTANGVPSEAIFGAMGDDERKAALQRYQAGETRCLTNYGVLTEGVNLPSTACVLLARPTRSNLLVTQMLGRGTRLFEGKQDCLVLDIVDVCTGKSLVTAASISGLPAEMDLQGEDLFETKKRYDTLEELSPSLAAKSMTAADVERNIKLALDLIRARQLDLLQREERLTAQKYESGFAWYRIGDYNFEISPDGGATYYGVFCDLDDAAAPWCIAARSEDAGDEWSDIGTRYANAADAIAFADQYIARKHRSLALIRLDAKWREDLATEKQMKALRRFREPFDPETLTKGEACQRLNELYSARQYAA
jgi:superfamily II DNA or RNA helicase